MLVVCVCFCCCCCHQNCHFFSSKHDIVVVVSVLHLQLIRFGYDLFSSFDKLRLLIVGTLVFVLRNIYTHPHTEMFSFSFLSACGV